MPIIRRALLLAAFAIGALPLSAASHTYWRILISATAGNDFAAVGELKFYDASGNSLTSGGTAIASSVLSSFVASNAFDGNLSTDWISGNQLTGGQTAWIGYQFASAVSPASFVLWNRDNTNTTQWPTGLKAQYSDDNVTWTDATSVFNPTTWPAAQQGAFGFPITTPASGYYLNWRVNTTVVSSSGTLVALAELTMATSLGGSSIVSSAAYQEANSITSTFVAANAFDGNTSTFWASSALPAWIGCVFAVPEAIAQIKVTPRQDGTTNQSPTTFTLDGSNDGHTWTSVASYNTTWPNANTQTFTGEILASAKASMILQ